MKSHVLLALLSLAFIACKSKQEKSFIISDFRKDLQPYLLKAVNSGVVWDESASDVIKNATDEDLKQLSKAEIPLLRATALIEMLRRPAFNQSEIIFSHINDTAFVETDEGEFGTNHSTVIDATIENAIWKDSSIRQRIIDTVIIKHNGLKMAYNLRMLWDLKPEEKYYSSLKEMANRDKWFEQIESVLYALAKYKKQEDIPFIHDMLLSNTQQISYISSKIMGEFPNDSYLEVYCKYFRRRMTLDIYGEKNFEDASWFFSSLASYKNWGSAAILDSVLNRKPFINNLINADMYKNSLEEAIWDNLCPAYSKIREQIKGRMQKHEAAKNGMDIEPFVDTMPMSIRW